MHSGPPTAARSSADHSRVIRAGYGADAIYSRWATAGASATGNGWSRSAAAAADEHRRVVSGRAGQRVPRARCHDTLTELELAAEWIEPSDIAERFPVIAIDGLGPALFEPDAGVLRARTAVQAIVAVAATRAGVDYRRRVRVTRRRDADARPCSRWRTIPSSTPTLYVMACGPWLPKVFPAAVGGRIRPTRQEVLYFGVPPGDTASRPAAARVDRLRRRRLRHSRHRRARLQGRHRPAWPAIDPDAADRVVIPDVVVHDARVARISVPRPGRGPTGRRTRLPVPEHADGRLHHRSPSRLAERLDRRRRFRHGFKHGPAVARYVVNLIADERFAQPAVRACNENARRHRAVY